MVRIDPDWRMESLGLAADRAPGVGEPLRVAALQTPLGRLLAGYVGDDLALLTAIDGGRPQWNVMNVRRWHGAPVTTAGASGLEGLQVQLAEYFGGTRVTFDLPLATVGTPFQQEVWALLRTIPYGQTKSYGQVAQALGRPAASRAVGQAVGANPVFMITPCHRVLAAGGKLGGFGGGLDMKRRLLCLEGAWFAG